MKWEEVRLGDILKIKHGYAFKGKYICSERTDNILLTPGNFAIGGGYKNTKLKYYNGEVPPDYILKFNDIIVTMTDLSKEADTLGFSAKIPNEPNNIFLHNQRIGLLLFSSDKYDKDYIYWLLRSRNYQKFVAGSASGATVKPTSPSRLYAFKWKCPPIETQKKIAKTLSNYDDLIENNLKQIKLLEEKARLTYEEWFLRFRVDGVKLEIDSESGLPFGWEETKLEDLCEITSSKRIFLSDYVDDGIPFYRGKEISIKSKNNSINDEYFISKEKFEEIEEKFGSPKANNILITAVGTLGSIYLIKKSDGRFYFKDGNLIWLKDFKKKDYYYLYYLLKSESYQEYLHAIAIGSSQKALTIKALSSVKIKYPIEKIILKFNKIVEPLNNKIENLTLQNQNLKEARDILLPRLMTGVIEL